MNQSIRTGVLAWCFSACATAAPLLEVELRWVEQALPGRSGALTSSAGAPVGVGTVRSGSAADGHLGGHPGSKTSPVLRVQSGSTAHWQFTTAQALVLARVPAQGLRVDVPLSEPTQTWRLEATPTGPNAKGQIEVRVSWQQPEAGGAQQQWQSTVPVRAGRWTALARTAAPAPPEPGTLRSSDTTHPLRELQIRVTPVLSAAE